MRVNHAIFYFFNEGYMDTLSKKIQSIYFYVLLFSSLFSYSMEQVEDFSSVLTRGYEQQIALLSNLASKSIGADRDSLLEQIDQVKKEWIVCQVTQQLEQAGWEYTQSDVLEETLFRLEKVDRNEYRRAYEQNKRDIAELQAEVKQMAVRGVGAFILKVEIWRINKILCRNVVRYRQALVLETN